MKSVIVVAEDKLKTKARRLVHTISSEKDVTASLWSPKQYEDNEAILDGEQYILFLGKNSVSEDFIPLIEVKYEKQGINWGYDASKAVIYIVHSDVTHEDLKEVLLAMSTSRLTSTYFSPALWTFFSVFGFMIARFVKRNIDRAALEELQYDVGISTFLEEGLQDWLSEAIRRIGFQ